GLGVGLKTGAFPSGPIVQSNGSNRRTIFLSATQLPADILPADIATPGTASITVVTPAPGGGTSNALTFTINAAAPTITSLNPTSAVAGGWGFTLFVNGTGFVPGSIVQFNGSNRTTRYLTPTKFTPSLISYAIS